MTNDSDPGDSNPSDPNDSEGTPGSDLEGKPADLADRVASGDLRLHELEVHVDHETAAAARRHLLERETDADLDAVGKYSFAAADAEPNIENMIGAVGVPVGIAGPVSVAGGAVEGEKYLPLATTEGALVASVNRGCGVIRESGGANARILKSRMTRAPVFRVADVTEAERVVSWVRGHTDGLRDVAEGTTSHGELVEVTPYVVGDSVFLRFGYDTKDAMGMNMATIATQAACDRIEEETPAELVALSGNLCTDKKPAAINAVEGRGRSVTADVEIDREVIEDRLHTTPEAIDAINTRKNLVGSAKAASLGFNAQAANVVAAAFLATGQDGAQVVEGANTITTTDVREASETLYASVSLASLEVGTVGGGTKLPTQAAGLDVVGVRGGGDPAGSNADALAEVISVGVLAGELSLLGALASRHLSSAHEQLGR